MRKNLFFMIFIALMASCTHKNQVVQGVEEASVEPKVIENKPMQYLPRATVFRMSGDYSKNIAITLSPSGEVSYYPDPRDISAYSEPVELVDGWWLNCQGFGQNSVFTKYTFAEYASLPEAPTLGQLKASIIPGAKVTQFMQLPVTLNGALNDLETVKTYLKNQ